ncbi:MAG TPA: hypothetical protein VF577_02810 [Allosphingosinicella sp.]|jgi:hypothetical protein
MRPSSCHGAILLALLSACESVPESVKIEIDGRTFEIKKKRVAAEAAGEQPR